MSEYQISISELYALFERLRAWHGPYGATELAYFDFHGVLHSGRFDDVEKMVAACAAVTDARSFHFGLNPVVPDESLGLTNSFALGSRASKRHVSAITMALFDFNVVTPGHKQAASKTGHEKAPCTDAEHALAVVAAEAYADAHPGAWVIETNGAQVLVRVLVTGTNEELQLKAEHNVKAVLLEAQAWWEAQPYTDKAIAIDPDVHDLSRMAAMTGTWKRDGKETRERTYRPVQVVREGSEDPLPELSALLNAPVVLPERRAARERARREKRDIPLVDQSLQRPPGLCEGWYYTLMSAETHPKTGRSGVLSGLALKLDELGVDEDLIIQLVLEHDRRLGQKLADRADPDQYVQDAIDTDKSAPGCTWVQQANGTVKPCLGCSQYRPAKNAPKAFDLGDAAPVSRNDEVEIVVARDIIVTAILAYLRARDASHTLLIGGPPGLGKTTITSIVVAKGIDLGMKFAIVVDRLELADDLARQIDRPRDIQILRGMDQMVGGQPMCMEPQRREEVRRAGLEGLDGALACDGCPQDGLCPYTRQFQAIERTWIMSAAMMVFRLKDWMFENGADFAVLDEGALGAHTSGKWEVTAAEVAHALAAGLDVSFLLSPIARGEEPFAIHALSALTREGRQDHEIYELRRLAREINRSSQARQAKRVVPLAVIELLNVLAETLRAAGAHRNTRLEAQPGKVVVRNPRDLRISAPTIVLDSTGNPDVYEHLLGRPVRHVTPAVPSKATVLQLVTGRFGRASMQSAKTRTGVFDGVVEIVKAMGTPSAPVAVVTMKAYEKELEERLAGLDAVVMHYAAVRGTNAVIDRGCNHIVLAGTYAPNLDELLAWSRARAWQDPERVDPDFHTQLERLPGTNLAVPVLRAKDPRVDPWLQMLGPGEMLQAAERLRTRTRTEPAYVWVLSNQPVPELSPTFTAETVTALIEHVLNGFLPTKRAS